MIICHTLHWIFLRLFQGRSPPNLNSKKTSVTYFRINTYRWGCKQTTLSRFRINNYIKTGGGGLLPQLQNVLKLPRPKKKTPAQVPSNGRFTHSFKFTAISSHGAAGVAVAVLLLTAN